MPGEDYNAGSYLGEYYDEPIVVSGEFPPSPPNRSYSNLQNPTPPFQTLPYKIEST